MTFEKFAQLARKNGWTIDDLSREFRGGFGGKLGDPSYETSRHYFERVLAGRRSPKSVIVYGSVIAKYLKAVQYSALEGHLRRCECRCGSAVYGRKRFATDACRQRAKRARDELASHGPLKTGENESATTRDFP